MLVIEDSLVVVIVVDTYRNVQYHTYFLFHIKQ